MRVVSGTASGASRLAALGHKLSANARRRLKWMDYYHSHGRKGRLTCRHFDISPQSLHRWLRRYNPRDLATLEERSRRPHHTRQPTWSPELARAVQQMREQFPRWGKDKLAPLLRKEGWECSTSMIGRLLTGLRKRGALVEPIVSTVSARKPRPPRPYAVRKPKHYQACQPGDIVQVDTLDLRPLPGVVLKHFTARDVVSRWDVLEVHSRATATTAATFLDAIQARMPFPVRAIQVDGGSEFHAAFEAECQRRQIRLFVLPPRSPKLNGHVERAQRTHTEEFYQIWDLTWTVAELTPQVLAWERVYNTVRPHQALAYRTPQQFLQQEFSLASSQ